MSRETEKGASPPFPSQSQFRHGILAAWLMVLLTAGCGSVGEPLPPLLNIPERSGDFRARQVQDSVLLEWTWPALTTEGMPASVVTRFDVHALAMSGPGDPPSLEVFERESTELASLSADDLKSSEPGGRLNLRLPAEPMRGKILALAVRAQSRRGRVGGFSNLFVLAVIAPPAKPGYPLIQVEPTDIVLTWEPAPGADSYQILRAEKADGPFRELGRSIEPRFRDNAFQWDRRYFYLVKSFARSQTGEVEGGASETIAIDAHDRFAPAAPSGSRAVVGTASVELSWQHNSEPDVAGYRVWRGDSAVSLAPLTAELLRAANYTDSQVSPGRTYVYAISAIDQNGNESAHSEVVGVTVPDAAAAP